MLHVDVDCFVEVREFISKFAVAEKTPEHIHIYKIDAVSLWNAAVLGYKEKDILAWLMKYSQFWIPNNVKYFIKEQILRYWTVKLLAFSDEKYFILEFLNEHIKKEIINLKEFDKYIFKQLDENKFLIEKAYRWKLKWYLIELWFPVEDLIWYDKWDSLEIKFKDWWWFREYQKEAIDSFWSWWNEKWGSWVIVLACWWWKTIVWLWVIWKTQTKTLIITTTANATYQFKNEILNKTYLTEKQVWIFAWKNKEIKDITIATYSMLTFRDHKTKEFKYTSLFNEKNWGLIIYDEVHVLPAPVFSFSTTLQAKRRLWLTATLVREDHKENMIFWLIWPKRYDMPWKDLENIWFIAKVECKELRVKLAKSVVDEYYSADTKKARFKIAASNPEKIVIVKELLKKHKNDKILIIWEYIAQLDEINKEIWLPIITWKVKPEKREELFNNFRTWKINRLLLSRVANFSIDLPDANVLIQVSWLYGSRQEEAQRLGRILRPKEWKNEGIFYSLVTKDSVEIEYAEKRQVFLMEQWYEYDIEF
jgi:DNA excision repair protein ERCC-3